MGKPESPRQRAERLGRASYEGEMPCKHGHLGLRNTISGACLICAYHRNKKIRARIKARKAALMVDRVASK